MNTLTATPTERITLYYREGSSDKVYQAAIEPAGERFVVNFAYGRRGSTLSTGTKTNVPVDYDRAKAIYERLVREKSAKGYTPGADGAPYQQTTNANRSTGILPMLLNPIDEDETARLLTNDLWCAQEKIDGRRVQIQSAGDKIMATNRKGLAISLPTPILVDVAGIPGDFTLDGDCVGDVHHAFDLLERDGENLRPFPLNRRLVELSHVLASAQHTNVRLVQTAYDTGAKQRLYDALKQANKEGVVLKFLLAPYTPGRPNSGGAALKFKFTATLSAVVSRINPKRSVELRLLGTDGWQVAGNVTIPVNQDIPRSGDVVEIRYLYAFPESGVLFQPVYLGLRSDIEPPECVASQLKFKPVEDDES